MGFEFLSKRGSVDVSLCVLSTLPRLQYLYSRHIAIIVRFWAFGFLQILVIYVYRYLGRFSEVLSSKHPSSSHNRTSPCFLPPQSPLTWASSYLHPPLQNLTSLPLFPQAYCKPITILVQLYTTLTSNQTISLMRKSLLVPAPESLETPWWKTNFYTTLLTGKQRDKGPTS